MSSKPKQKDYEASAAEKTSASVAMADHKYFKEKYDPLLQQMRDESLTDRATDRLRGRANADTMQALTKPSYARAAGGADGGDMAQAYLGQLGIANTSGKEIQNTMQTNVLGTARGQAADASSGMAQASKLATSSALTRAKNKQAVADAKFTAVGQVAGAALAQGLDNMGTTGTKEGAMPDGQSGPGAPTKVKGGFFSPVDKEGQKVKGFKNRLAYSEFFS